MSLLASAVARAFGLPPATAPRVNVERDVCLRSCDSVVLLTDLYLSRPIAPRPVILIRTPYGRAGAWGLFARGFAQRGYNVVIQRCRGTFGSSGHITFSAEAEDGRAAADWIVTQHWSNGEIGTFGPSYLSFVQWADLHLTSSTEHFDVFARLSDVEPSGRSINVCDGILRCGRATAQPIRVDLWPTAYRFARSHRVRLQVSGGAHPRFARNLGAGEPLATGTRLAVSARTVYHDPERPSCLTLPIVVERAVDAR